MKFLMYNTDSLNRRRFMRTTSMLPNSYSFVNATNPQPMC